MWGKCGVFNISSLLTDIYYWALKYLLFLIRLCMLLCQVLKGAK